MKKNNFEPQENNELIITLIKALKFSEKFYFFKNKCLVQSLAGRKILKQHKIEATIYLGVSNSASFVAHAWLVANDYIITPKDEKFKEILKIE